MSHPPSFCTLWKGTRCKFGPLLSPQTPNDYLPDRMTDKWKFTTCKYFLLNKNEIKLWYDFFKGHTVPWSPLYLDIRAGFSLLHTPPTINTLPQDQPIILSRFGMEKANSVFILLTIILIKSGALLTTTTALNWYLYRKIKVFICTPFQYNVKKILPKICLL